MSAIAELIERVEKATGPSRKIDVAVADAITPLGLPSYKWAETGNLSSISDPRITVEAPPYTASLDAVVALVEKHAGRLYPGISQNAHHQNWHAWLSGVDGDGQSYMASEGQSDFGPALALLLAFLRAIGEE